ncbi:MAG: hypothetical protein LBH27_00040 [Endomicrobium sp.]|jgi:hypothetical protein|nr:hypothetical protein [Endomicrobium sp.]
MDKKMKNLSIKTYVITIFLFVVFVFCFLFFRHVQKTPIDVLLNKKIIDAMLSCNITQDNISEQYAIEKSKNTIKWNEFYKTIKFNSKNNMILCVQNLEKKFTDIVDSIGIYLNKINNPDGSITYKFYLRDKNYYNIVFVFDK